MLKQLIAAFSLCFLGASLLSAQVQTFLPEGRAALDYQYSQQTYDEIHDHGSKKSVLASELKKSDVNDDEVSGSIEYTRIVHLLALRYGFSNTVNFSLHLPYVYRKRSSSLDDRGNDDNSSFLTAQSSAETSGMGDYQLKLQWRPVYTDMHDLQLSLLYDNNNGAYNYDKHDELALGNGTRDIGTEIDWYVYPLDNTWRFQMNLDLLFSLDGKVKDTTGDKVKIQRKNTIALELGLQNHQDLFFYQGKLGYLSEANTIIDGDDQEDGVSGYYLEIGGGLSNLVKLEKGPVTTPWEVELNLRYNINGDNLPAGYIMGLKGSLYF